MGIKIKSTTAEWIEDTIVEVGNSDCDHSWITETNPNGDIISHKANDFYGFKAKPEGWVVEMHDPNFDNIHNVICKNCGRIVRMREKITEEIEITLDETEYQKIKKQFHGE